MLKVWLPVVACLYFFSWLLLVDFFLFWWIFKALFLGLIFHNRLIKKYEDGRRKHWKKSVQVTASTIFGLPWSYLSQSVNKEIWGWRKKTLKEVSTGYRKHNIWSSLGVLEQSPEPEDHDKVLTIIQIELEFGNVGFWGEGKTGVPREKPFGARKRTNNKLNPHTPPGPGIGPGAHS